VHCNKANAAATFAHTSGQCGRERRSQRAGAGNNLLLRNEGSHSGNLIAEADTLFARLRFLLGTALLYGVGATLTDAIFLMMKNSTPDQVIVSAAAQEAAATPSTATSSPDDVK
jgi:hypothetical protein